MIGAIIGDIAGSRFEFDNCRSKTFDAFHPSCTFTDDSIMTLAIGEALLETAPDFSALSEAAVRCMRAIGQPYPHCGYGGRFFEWMYRPDPKPYYSFGNGAAMRVGGCIWAARSLEEAKRLARDVTAVTHNHPEGIKGAEATVVAGYLARSGYDKAEIRRVIEASYYPIDFTLDDIRETYRFNETCQDTVPQALAAFFESEDFEDTLRSAISIGGDSDTLAAIACSVAEAYYGVPNGMRASAEAYLDANLLGILHRFESSFPPQRASGKGASYA